MKLWDQVTRYVVWKNQASVAGEFGKIGRRIFNTVAFSEQSEIRCQISSVIVCLFVCLFAWTEWLAGS